jgi:hypothetical protein
MCAVHSPVQVNRAIMTHRNRKYGLRVTALSLSHFFLGVFESKLVLTED